MKERASLVRQLSFPFLCFCITHFGPVVVVVGLLGVGFVLVQGERRRTGFKRWDFCIHPYDPTIEMISDMMKVLLVFG